MGAINLALWLETLFHPESRSVVRSSSALKEADMWLGVEEWGGEKGVNLSLRLGSGDCVKQG